MSTLNDRWHGAAIRYVQRGGEFLPIIRDDDGGEREVVWAPQPGSQMIFLACTDVEVLYEGNRGGGKTDTLLMDFLQDVGVGWGSEWRGILFRQTHPMLSDVIEKSKKWIPRLYGKRAWYNEIKFRGEWETGEQLYFAHLNTEADYNNYHGHHYSWIAFEELTTWAEPTLYNKMFSTLRSTAPRATGADGKMRGMPRKIRATTNPWGAGHNWVQERFQLYNWPRKNVVLGPRIEGKLNPITNMREPTRRAIHSDLAENQILKFVDPEYIDRISRSADNEELRKAWVDGSWDITAGGMFDDIWAKLKHVIVVPEFDVPARWPIFRALDYGSSKPWSVGYYAESDGSDLQFKSGKVISTVRGDLFRVGEVYGWTGQPNEGLRLPPAEITKRLVAYEIKRGWRPADGTKRGRVKAGPADTGIFDEHVPGFCIAFDFEKSVVIDGVRHKGIVWEKADKGPGSREQGWSQLRKRLMAVERPPGGYRETPGLFIMQENGVLNNWIRTVPSLRRDEKKVDDVDTEMEDHCGDECRYALRFERNTFKSGRIE